MYSDDKVYVRRVVSMVGLVLVLAGLIGSLAKAQVGGSIPPSSSEFVDAHSKRKYTVYKPL